MRAISGVSITPVLGPGSVPSPSTARRVRQQWEYRTISIPRAQDASAALNESGMDGWEVIDVQSAAQAGTLVLLKRPR